MTQLVESDGLSRASTTKSSQRPDDADLLQMLKLSQRICESPCNEHCQLHVHASTVSPSQQQATRCNMLGGRLLQSCPGWTSTYAEQSRVELIMGAPGSRERM